MKDERKLLGVIGMCRGAGKAVVGTDMVCEFLRKAEEKRSGGKHFDAIVIEASDTSENTHKKIIELKSMIITFLCNFLFRVTYNIAFLK